MQSLVQIMIGAFQRAVNANTAPVNRGLPLERLRALGGKEFNGIRGFGLTKAKYCLEGVEKIFELITCTNEEKGMHCVLTHQ